MHVGTGQTSRCSPPVRRPTPPRPQEALADRERRVAAAAAAQAATAVAAGAAAVAAAKESKDLSAAGTPYVQPGGQWSKFKTYSTFQRTWDIWRFGLVFFFKLWAVNQVWAGGGALLCCCRDAWQSLQLLQFGAVLASLHQYIGINIVVDRALEPYIHLFCQLPTEVELPQGRHDRGGGERQACRAGGVAARGPGQAGPHFHQDR